MLLTAIAVCKTSDWYFLQRSIYKLRFAAGILFRPLTGHIADRDRDHCKEISWHMCILSNTNNVKHVPSISWLRFSNVVFQWQQIKHYQYTCTIVNNSPYFLFLFCKYKQIFQKKFWWKCMTQNTHHFLHVHVCPL